MSKILEICPPEGYGCKEGPPEVMLIGEGHTRGQADCLIAQWSELMCQMKHLPKFGLYVLTKAQNGVIFTLRADFASRKRCIEITRSNFISDRQQLYRREIQCVLSLPKEPLPLSRFKYCMLL